MKTLIKDDELRELIQTSIDCRLEDWRGLYCDDSDEQAWAERRGICGADGYAERRMQDYAGPRKFKNFVRDYALDNLGEDEEIDVKQAVEFGWAYLKELGYGK